MSKVVTVHTVEHTNMTLIMGLNLNKSLHCHWQTGTTRCLTPTMLYTVSVIHWLVTNDHHQFITLTIHLSWQHLRWWRCS